MTYDVLVYGPLFCDLIFTRLPGMPVLGAEIHAEDFTVAIGGSAIVAAGLQKLGAKVGIIADLGNDRMSQIMAEMLDELQLDQTLIRRHPHPLPQVTVSLSFPEDRAFVTRFDKPEKPVDLAGVLEAYPTHHLLLYGAMSALESPNAPEIARRHGVGISLDPGWDEAALRDEALRRIIADVDFFMPNRSELCFLTGTDNIDAALALVSDWMNDGTIIMKNGKDGAIVHSHTLHDIVPALPVTPVDTTGAGDAFNAGFLYAHTQGKSLDECLRYGTVCGALATTQPGGATAAPTLKEVETWFAKLP